MQSVANHIRSVSWITRESESTATGISAGAVVMDDRGSSIRDADESAPTSPNSFSGYIASKAQGEAAVLAANKPGFRALAICPTAIWGPGDPFSRALPDAIGSGKFAFIERGDYPFAICHVDNVIEAVQCALVRGTGGRAYFIKDHEPTTFRDFVAMLADLRGLSIGGLKSVSYRLAFTLGRLMEIGCGHYFIQRRPIFVANIGAHDRAGVYRERCGRAA